MTAPSEHVEAARQFADDAWARVAPKLNGHEATPQQELLTRAVLEAIGLVREDIRAHERDGGHLAASRKTVATIVGGIGAAAAAVVAGIREALT